MTVFPQLCSIMQLLECIMQLLKCAKQARHGTACSTMYGDVDIGSGVQGQKQRRPLQESLSAAQNIWHALSRANDCAGKPSCSSVLQVKCQEQLNMLSEMYHKDTGCRLCIFLHNVQAVPYQSRCSRDEHHQSYFGVCHCGA